MFDFSKVENDVSLKNFCTFKIGGCAKFLFVAKTIDDLLESVRFCIDSKIKFKVIGLGANLLFLDKGFDGMIIVNETNQIKKCGNMLCVDSGLTITELLSFCVDNNLSGLEGFAGIPSTFGGAVTNSLGSGDYLISNLIHFVEAYALPDTEHRVYLSKNDCDFAYRDSIFKHKNFLITRVGLKLQHGEKSDIYNNIVFYASKKIQNQPLEFNSAGSIFKRTDFIPSKLIDELGLKGKRIGGAMISNKHAGFIVNIDNATTQDVENLIDFVTQEIKNKCQKIPKKEIEIVR